MNNKKEYSYSVDTLIDCELKGKDVGLPIPLSVFPNYMGINLVSVDKIEWTELEDGQLLDLKIIFKPNFK